MVVSILGCGWYGTALAKLLLQKGITVKGSATSAKKLGQLEDLGIIPCPVKYLADNQVYDPAFFECDVLVISIPPGFRHGEAADYLPKVRRIIQTILQFQIKKIIYISSTGVYGDNNGEVNELDNPNPDSESGKILLEAEKLLQNQPGFKTTIIRCGGLVGPGRNPGRFFAGKKDIPNGLAAINLIHQQDCVGISAAVIEKDAFGYVFNACAPDHPQKAGFYREAALKADLPFPEFINELKSWKVVNSINLGNILNYQFKVKQWSAWSFNE